MSHPSSRKKSNRKKTLLKLVLSLISARQVWKLRNRYSGGDITIAELSRLAACPPVLLYCVLSPLKIRTAMKLKMLRLEMRIDAMRAAGKSVRTIARTLKLPESVVREYADDLFGDATCKIRPWYHDRAPKPPDPNELNYDPETLPPTSRIGWTDGALTDIPKEHKGRCPICGHQVFLPCLACRVRHDMEQRKIATAEEYDPADEDEDIEPDLLFL